jgi:hypothetical protein
MTEFTETRTVLSLTLHEFLADVGVPSLFYGVINLPDGGIQ